MSDNIRQKNIAVLVSGGGTNLQALIDVEKSGKNPNGKIVSVISSKPDAYALTRAKQNYIPASVVSRKNFSNSAEYSAEILRLLKESEADLIVLAGFLTILDESVCRAYPNKILNIHPALLPAFGGAGYYGLRVHEAVLKRGVRITGATAHFVSGICDDGPIVLQKAVYVKKSDTPEILQKRVMEEAERIILPEAVKLFCDEKITVKNNIAYIS